MRIELTYLHAVYLVVITVISCKTTFPRVPLSSFWRLPETDSMMQNIFFFFPTSDNSWF
jgi:hypothetical protein